MPTTTTTTQHQIPAGLIEAIEADPRIQSARVYADGWVPNAYNYKAPGTCIIVERAEDGTLRTSEGSYDRRRSHGEGPRWVVYSARGGRLASGR